MPMELLSTSVIGGGEFGPVEGQPDHTGVRDLSDFPPPERLSGVQFVPVPGTQL
jgi:hypothetical protein